MTITKVPDFVPMFLSDIGRTVNITVTIQNTGTIDLYIDDLTDRDPTLRTICPGLIGMKLVPQQSVSCIITTKVTGNQHDFVHVEASPPSIPSTTGGTGKVCDDPDPNKCIPPCPRDPKVLPLYVPCVKNPPDPASADADLGWSLVGPPPLVVGVTKTNDADGDGTPHIVEAAPGPGKPVTFTVVITNFSLQSVTISDLTDASPPGSGPIPVCSGLVGVTVLPPFGSVTCSFTLAAYSPASGTTLSDKFTARVSSPGGSGEGSGTSTVITPSKVIITTTTSSTTSTSSTSTSTSTSTSSTSTSTTSTSTSSTSTTSTSTSTTSTTSTSVPPPITSATGPPALPTMAPHERHPVLTEPVPAPPRATRASLRAASTAVLPLTGVAVGNELALAVVALVVGAALVVATGGRRGRRRPLEGRITGL